MIRRGGALIGALALVALVVGPVEQAFSNDAAGRDPPSIWIRAQQGDAEAQYWLASYYERRYWLAERDLEIRGNPLDMLHAYTLFSLAKSSNDLDALYGWHGTKYCVEQILGSMEREALMVALPKWLRGEGASPSRERDPARPEGARGAIVHPETIDVPGQTSKADVEHSAAPWQNPKVGSRLTDSYADLKTLLTRGISYLDSADPVSARRFLELASKRGSGEAAMLVAKTYDPEYIDRLGVAGLNADIEQAARWYRTAIELGNEEAEARLQGLMQRLEPALR